MKIIKNTSKFDTKKLRSLFSYVHNLIAKTEGRLPQWNGLQVQVRQKSYGTSGQAYVGKVYGSGWDMFLSISEKVILKDIVNLFSHELMHSYGFHHRNMLIARDCDVMMAYIPNGRISNGSISAIKKAKKFNKPVTIVS